MLHFPLSLISLFLHWVSCLNVIRNKAGRCPYLEKGLNVCLPHACSRCETKPTNGSTCLGNSSKQSKGSGAALAKEEALAEAT